MLKPPDPSLEASAEGTISSAVRLLNNKLDEQQGQNGETGEQLYPGNMRHKPAATGGGDEAVLSKHNRSQRGQKLSATHQQRLICNVCIHHSTPLSDTGHILYVKYDCCEAASRIGDLCNTESRLMWHGVLSLPDKIQYLFDVVGMKSNNLGKNWGLVHKLCVRPKNVWRKYMQTFDLP